MDKTPKNTHVFIDNILSRSAICVTFRSSSCAAADGCCGLGALDGGHAETLAECFLNNSINELTPNHCPDSVYMKIIGL
ncbi:Hypothetical protein SMAX5B_010702 [Scophthalmus maximus]|uniref:Uncharacterized protein n=1 Tax=Scophthalmus maximus TaxID=52904 RepID=A0A2U9C8P5_SCOMX|nr:Hypothetical protein SMAX5B_010702 [Scophthalmus maximus]